MSQVSVTPISRINEGWWKDRHAACVEATKRADFDVAFLGDSITQGWEGSGKEAWNRDFAPFKAANFGFSGDRTEHVLWRLDNGELLGSKAKLVVIMIGTNNVGHGSSNAGQTAEGIGAILKKLEKGLPQAKVLLLAVFPRSNAPGDAMRLAVEGINVNIRKFDDGKRVFFKDISHAFVRHDGTLRSMLMPDQLHLNADGYDIWAKAIRDDVRVLTAP